MPRFLDVWAFLADRICQYIQSPDSSYRSFDCSPLQRCKRSFEAILKSQQVFAWWLFVREVQIGTCQDLIIPCGVLREMIQFGSKVPSSELDYHPAMIGPKSLIILILSRAQQLQNQDHPAHARWERGADLPLHDTGMRSLVDRSLATLGQYRQAEMDAFFLTLCCLLTRLRKYAWQLSARAISCDFTSFITGHDALRCFQQVLHSLLVRVHDMEQPLQWDPYAHWQLL